VDGGVTRFVSPVLPTMDEVFGTGHSYQKQNWRKSFHPIVLTISLEIANTPYFQGKAFGMELSRNTM
jgi:hypothetical protein